ncbi:ParA family protein [Glycomyces arizonensis]|uniref:ParA family protein n=1 Tax=Glycomyces arizonensis TaxID=256035 RepID=UPI003F6DC2BA
MNVRDPLPPEDREHQSALGGDTPAERRIKNILDAAVSEENPTPRRRRYRETSQSPGGEAQRYGSAGPESVSRETGPSYGYAAGGTDPVFRSQDDLSNDGGERGGMRKSTTQRGRSGRHTAPEAATDDSGRRSGKRAATSRAKTSSANGRNATTAPADDSATRVQDQGDEIPQQGNPLEDDLPLAREAQRAVRVLNPAGAISMPRPPRRRVFAVANQKGGVGKTTSAVNIAVALALHGNRVMVIDLDPQGNASTGLGVEHGAGTPSVYEALVDGMPLDEIAQRVEGIPSLHCIPATIDLAGAEVELVNVVAREARLQKTIEAYGGELDYIFIDCPPSLGLLTVNALVAAEEVLIPIQCEYYALEGLGQLLRNIELVKAHLNSRLRVSTILLTMYDKRTKLADQVEQEVRGHFSEIVLDAVVPRSVRVSEAPGYGQSIMTYDPGSRGATSYFEAAEEIARRGAKLNPRRAGQQNEKDGK